MQEPARARQAGLEGLHRETLEGTVQEQAGQERRHGDEADQRERELPRDAPAEEVDERFARAHSGSKR